ncbi:hypothetical protein HMPREF9413_5205 [Paenibacillus sp. HGF7]|nr:hypothetical protein HMPREF9413_5205 [Paenibacillus sp. HGF7]
MIVTVVIVPVVVLVRMSVEIVTTAVGAVVGTFVLVGTKKFSQQFF